MTIATDESPTAVIERFLRAMSDRDVDGMFAEQSPDIVCTFPTAPGGPQEIRGWDANRSFYSTYIHPMCPTFAITRIDVHAFADDPERIVVEYASDGLMVDGSRYQNRYLSLGTVRNGKIERWTEYSDPAPFEQAQAELSRAREVGNDLNTSTVR